jgi:hypothetical protein
MCGVTAMRTDLRISIQRRGTTDVREGHLAVGLLLDSDSVMVPAPPPEWLSSADLEALIIPNPLRLDTAVERFRLNKMIVMGIGLDTPTAGRPMAACLTLHGASRYASQVGHFDSAALGTAVLETGGDMRAALLSLGAVTTEQFEIDTRLLDAATRFEREQSAPRHVIYSVDSLEKAPDICWIPGVCRCETTGPYRVAAETSGG